ncbi:helicase swr1 [Massarina eburnea CBS 473.64]|uniref:DNA helicase n=1 Tax=Massarina eburnea CBS 473.64 TaxID=1395130 RepID=A0A6A6RSF5_9PLEO|nr:helicase swr1 [Massarina eburnea CBS 473.64]
MDVEVEDTTSSPNTPNVHDASAAAHAEPVAAENGTRSINAAQQPLAHNDETVIAGPPAKRRKLEDIPSRPSSRAPSPPWKPFAADGPTTIFDNGVRKSSRVNREAPAPPPPPPQPEPSKPSSRPPKGTQTNGSSKASAKLPASRRSTPAGAKRPSVSAVHSPTRKSERQRKSSAFAPEPVSPAFQNESSDKSAEGTRKRPSRGRRATQTFSDDVGTGLLSSSAADPSSLYNQYSPTHETNTPLPTPRLRIRFGASSRKLDPPNRHPRHAPPPQNHPSFADWLEQDDPLEGEEGQRVTREKAEEEAQRRLQIEEAAESGVLSVGQCSIFQPEPVEEPPRQYGHWDHVVTHALHFYKLLRDERTYHRRIAKTLAREAVDYWKTKFKRKTLEEIEQEEAERAKLRYKQLIKDVKDAWAMVKTEIDKERVAKWEEEQRQLGHKAMDDMFNQAQEILGRNVVDSASSLVSDDRDTEGEGRDFESVSDASEEKDENMSSSSDSERGEDNDEDANLTAEQLRAKYEQLPDLPDESSEDEKDEDEKEEEEDRGTPEATPDPDIEMEDPHELLGHPFTQTNGFHKTDEEGKSPDSIDPATVELDKVDDALLDSEDEGESGSEAWSSDEGSEDEEEVEDGSDSGSDEDGDGDTGMMGFLASADLKKLKEAAKSVVAGTNTEDTQATNGLNGHHPEAENTEELHANGDSKMDVDVSHVNGNDETMAASSIEVVEPEPMEVVQNVENVDKVDKVDKVEKVEKIEEVEEVEEVQPEKGLSANRSRHSSSPPRTEIPSLLRGTLREYQHDGLDWLANLYESETNGILADEMGLGKTIQTISLLAYIAVFREKWGPHLVVVPTSVMLNWEMEFKKFLPGFKILTYYGDINERKRKRIGWRNTGKDMINVVITSYQLILQDAAAFKMRAWQYLVLDEAHNIKNFKSQRWQTMLNLRTERRLLLTGTPLQNNIDELWSLLYFLMPAGFAGEGRIAGLEEFTMALKNPTSQILDQGRQQLDAEAQKIVKKLHEVLRPYLLRRLKADVEKQMPGKYEHVVYCKLSKRQRQLYDGFMGRASTKEILTSGNYMSIINCLMSLRKVCNHPDLFETRAIVTSMAMPKSVPAQYEIKDFLIRKRLHEGMEEKVNLDALNLVFAHREQKSKLHARRSQQIRATGPLKDLVERQTRRLKQPVEPGATQLQSTLAAMAQREQVAVRDHLQACLNLTRARTQFMPLYGKGLRDRLRIDYQDYTFGAREPDEINDSADKAPQNPFSSSIQYQQPMNPFDRASQAKDKLAKIIPGKRGRIGFRKPDRPSLSSIWYQQQIDIFRDMIPTLEQRSEALDPILTRFTCVTPAVFAEEIAPLTLSKPGVSLIRSSEMARNLDPFHAPRIRQSIAFPDKRLLQYDCGKLQRLATLLRDLQAGGHRALIFTQMTKVLDILEQFLNIHGHRYLRLDGATKVEQRQILTDRFNNDPKILCFILSSRSGGLGINLTGADTVIFYDLDWNPAMDKQCQDRSHRIGQTRDVHIYKFVSEFTIEANILRKSNQKRLLDDVIIQKGDFTTDTFNRVSWRDALDDSAAVGLGDEAGAAMDRVLGEKAGLLGDARVMGTVEDTEDRTAASVAQKEIVDEIHDDQVDFSESAGATAKDGVARGGGAAGGAEVEGLGSEEAKVLGLVRGDRAYRHVDEVMLEWCREEFGGEPWRPPTERQRRSRKGGDVHRTGKKKRY